MDGTESKHAASGEDEELMKNGNYIHDSAEEVFGTNACPVGDCLESDSLEAATKMEAAHKGEFPEGEAK